MKMKLNKALISLILAMAIVVSFAVPAFAAEPITTDVANVSRSTTTLPAGREYRMYNNGTFTFRNQETTGPFFVEGQWLKLSLGFGTAADDMGVSGIWLTIDVINADNNQVIYTVRDYVPEKGDRAHTDFTFDLGSGANKVRNIYLRYDASSYGQSNGYFRKATLTDVTSYVFGPL